MKRNSTHILQSIFVLIFLGGFISKGLSQINCPIYIDPYVDPNCTVYNPPNPTNLDLPPDITYLNSMVVTPCLIDPNSSCQPPVGDPFIENNFCQVEINRYLSRAATVVGLAELIHDGTPDDILKYCATIKAMRDMDIQLILGAYGAGSYHEHQLQVVDDNWYKAGLQVIKDINYVYDCAGKRRPIIQATVYEPINANNFDAAKMYCIRMPTWIISKYFDYYPEDKTSENIAHYFNIDGQGNSHPKTTLYFERSRITECKLSAGGEEYTFYAQIDFIEARMWYLYQAFTVIDMGYKAIHMGLPQIYANNDTDHSKMYKLTQVIRQYASSKSTFVLLSYEPTTNETDKYLKDGNNYFVYDFDSRAMRPREISDPQVSGDGNGNGCTQPINSDDLEALQNSPCPSSGFPAAVVDPCTIASWGGGSGYTPLGCFVEQQPYMIHFDGYGPVKNGGVASNGPTSHCWGYNDNHWFTLLDPACQVWWYNYFYCRQRDYSNGNGWMVVPGILYYSPGTFSGMQFISDNIPFIDKVKATLTPITPPGIELVTKSCQYTYGDYICNDNAAPPRYCFDIGNQCYTIHVTNKDCSSVYSIHIQKDGIQWLPYVVRDEYDLCPIEAGTHFYRVFVNQDNLNLPGGGTQIHQDFNLTGQCCNLIYVGHDECIRGPISNAANLSSENIIRERNNFDGQQDLVHPNPTSDEININNPSVDHSMYVLTISNLLGNIQYQENVNYQMFPKNIDVSNFNNGTYILQLKSSNFINVQKFVKN